MVVKERDGHGIGRVEVQRGVVMHIKGFDLISDTQLNRNVGAGLIGLAQGIDSAIRDLMVLAVRRRPLRKQLY